MGTNNLKDFIHNSELNRKTDWDRKANWEAIETRISKKEKNYFNKILPLILLGLFLITASFLFGYYWGITQIKSANSSDNINLNNPLKGTIPVQPDTIQILLKDSIYIVEKIEVEHRDTVYILVNQNIIHEEFEEHQHDSLQKSLTVIAKEIDIQSNSKKTEFSKSQKNPPRSDRLNKRTNKIYVPYIFIEDTLDQSKVFQKIEWSKNNRLYFTNIQRQ